MAGRAVRESVTLAGRAERARAARAFVSEVLGPGHPCGDVAVPLVRAVPKKAVSCGAPGTLPPLQLAVPLHVPLPLLAHCPVTLVAESVRATWPSV